MFVHWLQIVCYFVHGIYAQFDLHAGLGVHIQWATAFDNTLFKRGDRVEVGLHRHWQIVLNAESIEHN